MPGRPARRRPGLACSAIVPARWLSACLVAMLLSAVVGTTLCSMTDQGIEARLR